MMTATLITMAAAAVLAAISATLMTRWINRKAGAISGDASYTEKRMLAAREIRIKVVSTLYASIDFAIGVGLMMLAVYKALYEQWSAATFYLLLAWCFAWMQKNRWRK